MASIKGRWTSPGIPVPSAHLIANTVNDEYGVVGGRTRCGRTFRSVDLYGLTDEVPATGKTCESCLRLSARDS